jgi:uncharacterized protein
MNRRQFMRLAALACVSGTAYGAWRWWPEEGLRNPCRASLPPELAEHPLVRAAWDGIDAAQVWDCHAHLFGNGDSGGGVWMNPSMYSLASPAQYVQRLFYMNAGCVHDAPGQVDRSVVARLENLVEGLRPGVKVMLFAFDWCHDESGRLLREASAFHVPNAYAAGVARAHPEVFEWVASIHPYRGDAVDALQSAAEQGARAVKWLPSAMGIDPASPKCDRFYPAAAQFELPIIAHAGRELAVRGGDAQHFGNPLRLRRAMEHGVRVVVAHCASDGDDVDLDRGANGPRVPSFALFARMMDDARFADRLYGDISAVTQLNRMHVLSALLKRGDWHPRLLNGSDYPLPGIMPLFSVDRLAAGGLVSRAAGRVLKAIREHNPLLFDFVLKRQLGFEGRQFAPRIFETRSFFRSRRMTRQETL